MANFGNFDMNTGDFVDSHDTSGRYDLQLLGKVIMEVVDEDVVAEIGRIALEETGDSSTLQYKDSILNDMSETRQFSDSDFSKSLGGGKDIENLLKSLEEKNPPVVPEERSPTTSHYESQKTVQKAHDRQPVQQAGSKEFDCHAHDTREEITLAADRLRNFIGHEFLDCRPLQQLDAKLLDTYLTTYLMSEHRTGRPLKHEMRKINKYLQMKKYSFDLLTSPQFIQSRDKALAEQPAVAFKNYTDSEMMMFAKGQRSKNTLRKIRGAVKKVCDFIYTNFDDDRQIEEMAPNELNHYLGNFFMNIRKGNGDLYEPDTLSDWFRNLDNHLVEVKYPYSLQEDEKFSTARAVLNGQRKNLKASGKGNKPNRSSAISPDAVDDLWNNGELGDTNGQILQDTIYFLLVQGFGFRGNHEAKQLRWGDVSFVESELEECAYLEWVAERLTKTRKGEIGGHVRNFNPKIYSTAQTCPERDPARLFRLYRSKRPAEMCQDDSPFFLGINRFAKVTDATWYMKGPLGKNKLAEIVKTKFQGIGYTAGKFTNHSLRRSLCQNLLDQGVPQSDIVQLTGHKNLQSLNEYAITSTKTQQQMSQIATLGKRPSKDECNVLVPAKRQCSGQTCLLPQEILPQATRPLMPPPTVPVPEVPNPKVPADSSTTSSQPLSHADRSFSDQIAGMFAHANINAPINVHINYNVASSRNSVQLSPKLPAVEQKE